MTNPVKTVETAAAHLILIVDDDTLTSQLVAHVLEAVGYQTMLATSGEQAMQMAVDHQPDLVSLDVEMPGMSGLEVGRHLKEQTAIPFMFVSSHSELDVVKQALAHGAIGYLTKPFETAQILPAFGAALARADDIRRLMRTEINLTNALASGRETSMAVGLLMAKFQIDRDHAFEGLREFARSNRRKINDVARQLLEAEEMFVPFAKMFTGRKNPE